MKEKVSGGRISRREFIQLAAVSVIGVYTYVRWKREEHEAEERIVEWEPQVTQYLFETIESDILSESALRKVIKEFIPEIVIHCASLTDIDFCENNRDLTKQINVVGSQVVVQSLKNTDARLIYISTDSVYDGIKGDFKERDKVKPQNFYGLTKYQGEREILRRRGSLTLRTNIFGWNIQDKSSIAEWIISHLSENKPINGFKDAYFSSIYTFELARIIELALKKGLHGTYNCASRTSLSKYEFALKLARRFDLDTSLVKPISIDDFGFKAKRGKNLSLNVDKLRRDLGCRLPTISNSIDSFYQDFEVGLPDKIRLKSGVIHKTTESSFIPYGRQSIDEDDIKAAVDVLRSDWITQGPKIKEFEEALCKYTTAKYAVCVANGTAALHIACLAADIKREEEVITSPITFVASANCVLFCEGKPVFADIQPDTANINPAEIKEKINERTKAIIPVHFAGNPCDLQEISRIAKKNKLLVIEDAAHALGAKYKGSRIGSCKYSDMTIFSFHPIKSITTGEGGAILTNRKDLYEKLLLLRNHGITKDSSKFQCADVYSSVKYPWYSEMQELGFNYRITDIQATLGLSQLKKVNDFIGRRRQIASEYDNVFTKIKSVTPLIESSFGKSAYHLYVLQLEFEKLGIDRFLFMEELKRHGVGSQVHYMPVYFQPYYQKIGYRRGICPIAEDYYKKTLSIPLYPLMTNSQVSQVIKTVVEILKKSNE